MRLLYTSLALTIAITAPVSATSIGQSIQPANEDPTVSIATFADGWPIVSIPHPSSTSVLSPAKNDTATSINGEDASPPVLAEGGLSDFPLQAKAIGGLSWPDFADDFTCKGIQYYRPGRIKVDCSHAPLGTDDPPSAVWRLYTVEFPPCGMSYSSIGTARWARKLLVEISKSVDKRAMGSHVEPTWESVEETANNWGNGIKVKFPILAWTGANKIGVMPQIEGAVRQALCWSSEAVIIDFVNKGCYRAGAF